jgi:hypothetical protein
VFWPLLDAETLVFTQFFTRDGGQTPVNYSIFLHLLNRLFVLMNAKHAGIYAFFKKSKIVT